MESNLVLSNLNLTVSFLELPFLCWMVYQFFKAQLVDKFDKKWVGAIIAVTWVLLCISGSECFVLPQMRSELRHGDYLVFAIVNSASVGLVLAAALLAIKTLSFKSSRNEYLDWTSKLMMK